MYAFVIFNPAIVCNTH